MSETSTRPSAKIYQFPVKVRASADAARQQTAHSMDMMVPRTTKIAVGGNWYHDAAIQESDRLLKR